MCSAACATAQTEITEQQSIALTRNIMRVSISSIAFLRGMFDASNFSIKDVGGTHCWVIESDNLHPNAKAIIDWMDNGVFDALGRASSIAACWSCRPAAGQNTIEAWSLSVGANNRSTSRRSRAAHRPAPSPSLLAAPSHAAGPAQAVERCSPVVVLLQMRSAASTGSRCT